MRFEAYHKKVKSICKIAGFKNISKTVVKILSEGNQSQILNLRENFNKFDVILEYGQFIIKKSNLTEIYELTDSDGETLSFKKYQNAIQNEKLLAFKLPDTFTEVNIAKSELINILIGDKIRYFEDFYVIFNEYLH